LLTNDTQTPAQTRSTEHQLSEGAAPDAPGRWSSIWWLALVGFVTVVLCAPFFRFLFFLGDEGTLLREAELVLRGQRLYADFFQFLPPGAVVVTAAWFSVAGVSFGAARSLAIMTFVGIACFTYLSCRQASRNAALSALLVVCWLTLSLWAWMQISHHWFATLLSVAAAWAAFVSLGQPERRLSWPLISGAAAGAVAMFVPHAGAFIMLAALTAFLNVRQQNWPQLLAYVFGCALAPAAVLAYLLEQHTLFAAFDDVILYTATHYTSINKVPFGFSASTINLPLKYVFGLAALLTLIVCAFDWPAWFSDRRLRLCIALALAGFLGCYPRPDMVHIALSAPLALPLLAFCMTRLTQSWRPAYRYAAAAALIAVCLPSFRIFQGRARLLLATEIVSTPRGGVRPFEKFTAQRGLPELLAAIAATPPGDAYFFYPYDAMLPFLTGRKHVSKYDILTPVYTTPAQYEEACRSVIRDASWVVVDRYWNDYNSWKNLFPSMPYAKPRETAQFEQALDSAFELTPNTGTFELRRRRQGVSDSVCDGIAG
jgi:hypothetical protein